MLKKSSLGDKGRLCHRHRHMIQPFKGVFPNSRGSTYWESSDDVKELFPRIIPKMEVKTEPTEDGPSGATAGEPPSKQRRTRSSVIQTKQA